MDAESPKRSATRKALVDSAFQLFEAKGFDEVTIDDIAIQAGVSRRTFFRYYPNKEAIVYPYSFERIDLFYNLVMQEAGGKAAKLGHVREIFVKLTEVWLADVEQMRVRRKLIASTPSLTMYDLWVSQKWSESMALAFDGMPNDGNLARVSVNSRLLAGAIIGSLRHVFNIWQDAGGDADLKALGLRAFDMIAHGYEQASLEA